MEPPNVTVALEDRRKCDVRGVVVDTEGTANSGDGIGGFVVAIIERRNR